jgi:DNA-binding CsgD family transcriptional regulator
MTPQRGSKDSHPDVLRIAARVSSRRHEHMFVSDNRNEITALLAQGLTLNEIAHRLGLARSTVGYHVHVLGEQQTKQLAEPHRHPGRRPPVASPGVTRERVRRLLETGSTRASIADALGLARSTVTYHARRLGDDIDDRCARRYDWEAVGRFYDAGHSVSECRSRFGFNLQSWHAAIHRGLITPRPARTPLEKLLVAGPRRSRNHLKQRLFAAGIKTRRCESWA